MSGVSHFPNVPLVTTNVATDSVRAENQDKAIIPPTKEVTQAHEERAIDPEKDQRREQQRSDQQSNSEKQDTVELSSDFLNEIAENNTASSNKKINAKEWLTLHYSALTRKDIRIKTKAEPESNDSSPTTETEQTKTPSQEGVNRNRKRIYQADPTISPIQPKLNEWS
ncbi:MAG: hypothetical protein ACPGUD_01535 [Parashewanella sp.]